MNKKNILFVVFVKIFVIFLPSMYAVIDTLSPFCSIYWLTVAHTAWVRSVVLGKIVQKLL